MSKKLNIIEAVNMPIGTRFKAISPNGYEYEVEVRKTGKHCELIDIEDETSYDRFNDFVANTEFIPIQKPVSFMEAIEAYKNGSDIKVKLNGTFRKYKRSNGALIDKGNQPINCYEILDGEWYIEED